MKGRFGGHRPPLQGERHTPTERRGYKAELVEPELENERDEDITV